jgi:hypothetical protein
VREQPLPKELKIAKFDTQEKDKLSIKLKIIPEDAGDEYKISQT